MGGDEKFQQPIQDLIDRSSEGIKGLVSEMQKVMETATPIFGENPRFEDVVRISEKRENELRELPPASPQNLLFATAEAHVRIFSMDEGGKDQLSGALELKSTAVIGGEEMVVTGSRASLTAFPHARSYEIASADEPTFDAEKIVKKLQTGLQTALHHDRLIDTIHMEGLLRGRTEKQAALLQEIVKAAELAVRRFPKTFGTSANLENKAQRGDYQVILPDFSAPPFEAWGYARHAAHGEIHGNLAGENGETKRGITGYLYVLQIGYEGIGPDQSGCAVFVSAAPCRKRRKPACMARIEISPEDFARTDAPREIAFRLANAIKTGLCP